jgi:hypothetical protein
VTEWNLPFGVPLFAWTVRLNALSVCFQLALWLLQGLHRFSRSPNIYNPGNLLSLKKQVHRMERIEFGHSFGTVEKQGRIAFARTLAE